MVWCLPSCRVVDAVPHILILGTCDISLMCTGLPLTGRFQSQFKNLKMFSALETGTALKLGLCCETLTLYFKVFRSDLSMKREFAYTLTENIKE